jgi:D-3-phosphoglycerate dehydrogenase
MLALARKVPELDQRVRAGEWPRGLVTQLADKTLGIVGTSRAGRKVAHLAASLGMNVITWSPAAPPGEVSGGQRVDLEQLLRSADVVSVHVRLSEASGKLLGAQHFALMKPTALFIHTERAGLVDEVALAQALASQTIAGAALDVFAQEPPAPDSPLRHLPNVILSPHTAASTADALEASLNAVADAVLRYLAEGRQSG